jgi:hypothetical protein
MFDEGMSDTKPHPAPAEEKKEIKIPTFGGGGPLPGVDLTNNAALLEILESERDSERRERLGVRPPRRGR